RTDDVALHRDVLRGIQEALSGQRRTPMPPNWPAVALPLTRSADPEVRTRTLVLGALFDDPQALATLHQLVTDKTAAARTRQTALQTLIHKKNPDLVPVLHTLLADPTLRGPALRGLAAYQHPETPPVILRHYSSFTDQEKSDAVQTLASRPAYALALLEAV